MNNKLATCQYAIERSMLNIKKSDRTENLSIRNKAITTDITLKIRRLIMEVGRAHYEVMANGAK